MRWSYWIPLMLIAAVASSLGAAAAEPEPAKPDLLERVEALDEQLSRAQYALDKLAKQVDDMLWLQRLGDVADVDKVYFPTVPNPRDEETYGIENELHPFKAASKNYPRFRVRRPILSDM